MANYEIQQLDLELLKSKFSNIWIKLELANIYNTVNGTKSFNSSFNPIANISGELKSGSYSCDSTSDVRRTLNVDFFVKDDSYNIGQNKKIWLDKFIIAYLGFSTYNVEAIRYYPLGIYLINTASYSYSLEDKSLSLSCVDLVCMLNGERSGLIPAMNSMKIECAPTICNAVVSSNDTDKIININIISDSYKPLEDTDDDTSPYFNCNVGFNISYSSLSYDKSYYEDYTVSISINGYNSYVLKDSKNPNSNILFSMLVLHKDYVCNFSGNRKEDFCFLLLGNPNRISNVMKSTIEDFSPFQYAIEDIGSDMTNADGSNPCYVPYDINLSTGVAQWDVITSLRDIYSGWETFFDVYGTFICRKLPTCEHDEISLDDSVLNQLVISEDVTYTFSSVKNVTEIWGKCQETDRYDAEPVITIDHNQSKVIIDLSLNQYLYDSGNNPPTTYSTSELLGFKMPDNIIEYDRNIAERNHYTLVLRVNHNSEAESNLPEITLIDDYASKKLTSFDKLLNGIGYCLRPKYVDNDSWYAIFCGEFQVHAVCMLVDTKPNAAQKVQDINLYNCTQISYIYNSGEVISFDDIGNAITSLSNETSPYSIEKCGNLFQVLSGNDYEKIYTSELARQRAEYETWKSARLTDSLTLTTRIIPFLDVNMKIKYKSKRTGLVDTYIIDKVNHSFNDCTSNIEMHKFYAAYPDIVKTNKED